MHYEFRHGGGVGGDINRPADGMDAQIVGESLELVRQTTGRLTPKAVVVFAEPDDSPIHEYFEWHDATAAASWREEQARTLIQSVYVVHERDGQTDSLVTRAFIAVDSEDKNKSRYESAARILSDPELYQQACQRAANELQAMAHRFASFVNIHSVVTKAHEEITEELRRSVDATEAVGSAQVATQH